MNEIVRMVSQKTGMDEAKSKQAVDTVLGFLRNKLPAPIASQIDNVISGNGGAAGKGMGGIGNVAKNVLGGEKSKR